MVIKFIVGLDLGQAQDYTALSILERLPGKEYAYHVRHLERCRGRSYPDIVDKVFTMMHSPALDGNAVLVVDQTGVGAPVVDMFGKVGLKPIGIFIHGGDKTSNEGSTWRVPKRSLVGVLQVLLQTDRLKVASRLPLGPVLSQEMLNFKCKIDPVTAHDSYSAWREQDHDDLVLSVAMAAWFGERSRPKPIPRFNQPAQISVGGGARYVGNCDYPNLTWSGQ